MIFSDCSEPSKQEFFYYHEASEILAPKTLQHYTLSSENECFYAILLCDLQLINAQTYNGTR